MSHIPKSSDRSPSWERIDRFAELRSRWVTLVGEHWRDGHGRMLEYWRVERASSVIVLPLHRGALLLPPMDFRPGVQRSTLDFPGGRLPDGARPATAVQGILGRELDIQPTAIVSVQGLSPAGGWDVDSSFSSQRLHGFVAQLDDQAEVSDSRAVVRVPADAAGVAWLLDHLRCLQCRAVLHAWCDTPR